MISKERLITEMPQSRGESVTYGPVATIGVWNERGGFGSAWVGGVEMRVEEHDLARNKYETNRGFVFNQSIGVGTEIEIHKTSKKMERDGVERARVESGIWGKPVWEEAVYGRMHENNKSAMFFLSSEYEKRMVPVEIELPRDFDQEQLTRGDVWRLRSYSKESEFSLLSTVRLLSEMVLEADKAGEYKVGLIRERNLEMYKNWFRDVKSLNVMNRECLLSDIDIAYPKKDDELILGKYGNLVAEVEKERVDMTPCRALGVGRVGAVLKADVGKIYVGEKCQAPLFLRPLSK